MTQTATELLNDRDFLFNRIKQQKHYVYLYDQQIRATIGDERERRIDQWESAFAQLTYFINKLHDLHGVPDSL